ncbi:MAG: dihydropteroate synthase-like protein [Candidatus Lokiarchaeota archaeon]|nr:dihydropteroate synthase-like protein [Candidatus Lokiarchaeota archaeon]MBD3342987.1 dihydropteroate synthase-like protein [Candidatus Lokiarchaeota archaeon]
MKILILTGQESYPILNKIVQEIKGFVFEILKMPVAVSAFITPAMVRSALGSIAKEDIDLVLLPGFVQWDTSKLEAEFNLKIRKGPEFASDLPTILKNLDKITLSNLISANKVFKISGEKIFKNLLQEQLTSSRTEIGGSTFFVNERKSDVIIGKNLPPPIIAEIVNCTTKKDQSIVKKAQHYVNSGADIIDIGCVSNNPDPDRVREVISLLKNNTNSLLSIDSMEKSEILAAVDEGIDMLLSFDLENYKDLIFIPKDIPIVILPTKVKEGYFPKDPKTRVKNLFELTKTLRDIGFRKLIADPLLETPISPGICNSLDAYSYYKKCVLKEEFAALEIPLFFGISNVVELMDVDSVGVNGLLASIALELDMGVVFTVEHSTKLMNGVSELKEAIKLNYIAKMKKTPPINQGIQLFKAKGKTRQECPKIDKKEAVHISEYNPEYEPDKNGYFKLYVDHYAKEIIAMFYSNKDILRKTLIGNNAEAISKRILNLNLTNNAYHINYLGRELSKAEYCLKTGKPYIQDE